MRLSSIALALALTFMWTTATPATAQADEVYTVVIKKAEEKKKSGWSLAEWLETRDRMRLMDLWLAIHSPSPYEFILGGDYQLITRSSASGGAAWGYDAFAAAYASVFGIGLRYSAVPSGDYTQRLEATLMLRFFGLYAQGTNLTAEGGFRQQVQSSQTYRNGFAGLSMNFYLARFIGLIAGIRYHFPSTADPSGGDLRGLHWEAGGFLDFSFVRVFGRYFAETDSAVASRNGVRLGLQFFF